MSTETKAETQDAPAIPVMPASWQRFIRRDLPLAVAILAICVAGIALTLFIKQTNRLLDEKDVRIADWKEQSAQYSRVVVGLAERGYSASDLANAGSKYFYSLPDSTTEKADSK